MCDFLKKEGQIEEGATPDKECVRWMDGPQDEQDGDADKEGTKQGSFYCGGHTSVGQVGRTVSVHLTSGSPVGRAAGEGNG